MGQEIERKFLIDRDKLGELSGGTRICQGYINTQDETAVRIRIKGEKAFLTIKGKNVGPVRAEFEYAIPMDDAQNMLESFCSGGTIDKTRYEVAYKGHTWEVDIFYGANQGLVFAEVELEDEHEEVIMPAWVTTEVTEDPRYYNVNLLSYPFCDWT
ncbi:MAG: adenylate cyclase [Alteromonadaceae bacterium]|nr:MAG: adenylate cyclase [Alteromonadaceae bacterium]